MAKSKKWSTGETREVSETPLFGLRLFHPRSEKYLLTTKPLSTFFDKMQAFSKAYGAIETYYDYDEVKHSNQEVSNKLIHLMVDEHLNMAGLSAIAYALALDLDVNKFRPDVHDFRSNKEDVFYTGLPLHGVLMVARNKDNQDIPGFTERRQSFVTTKTVEELQKEFEEFVSLGKEGEMVRLYYSINTRSQEKTQQELLIRMIKEEFNLAAIEAVVCSIAMKSEQALSKKWMFDFDGSEDELEIFLVELQKTIDATPGNKKSQEPISVDIRKTPNGHAVLVSRGFYVEPLLNFCKEKGIDVELKRDDFLCVDWKIVGGS